ncbi:hypothetical protein JNUCC74_07310 [Cerasibacillus sp. JNUCC 74]
MNQLNELKNQFLIIIDVLRKYGDNSNKPQILIIEEILNILESNEEDMIKFEKIKVLNNKLYPPRGGLGEFFIWDDDFDKRIEKNEVLEYAKGFTWKILNS